MDGTQPECAPTTTCNTVLRTTDIGGRERREVWCRSVPARPERSLPVGCDADTTRFCLPRRLDGQCLTTHRLG